MKWIPLTKEERDKSIKYGDQYKVVNDDGTPLVIGVDRSCRRYNDPWVTVEWLLKVIHEYDK